MLKKLSHLDWLGLILILILAFSLRLYKITSPLGDWHSWRQADTASVTREYLKHNYPFLIPRYHDLSNIPNGQENPEGYRMVEMPLVNYFLSLVLRVNPSWDLVVTSRLFSIICSLFTISFLFLIVKKLTHHSVLSLLTAFFFSVIPYSIYYSRTILPEPAMLAAQVGGLYFFLNYLFLVKNKSENKTQLTINYFLSALLTAMALLLKPPAIFIAPVFLSLSFGVLGWRALKLWPLYLFPFLVVAPLAWWRNLIQNFPTGIPSSTWLLNGNGIRLKPSWWHWLFAQRLAKLILGYFGIIFFASGLWGRFSKLKWQNFDLLVWSWNASMLFYLIVFATGNVQHDYYQIMLLPIIAITCARGLWWLVNLPSEASYQKLTWVLVLVGLVLSLSFGWYEVRGNFIVNNWEMVRAGIAADQLLPPDAKVIAPYGGDTAFLFQTNRTGWPVGGGIEDKISKGASAYISLKDDEETSLLLKSYPILAQTQEFKIIDLTAKKTK